MSITALIGPLQRVIGMFQNQRHYKDDKMDAALLSINDALIETKRYIEETDGKGADRKREFELSKLWADASVKARHASADLAGRLQDKSLYWSDTFEWSGEEVLSKKIDLDSIQAEVQALLQR
jgi:hypothetical protein